MTRTHGVDFIEKSAEGPAACIYKINSWDDPVWVPLTEVPDLIEDLKKLLDNTYKK